MRPIWYLDVDGVINMVRFGRPDDVPADSYRQVAAGKYRVIYDQRVVDFINEMHRSGNVEIVWLTTWVTDAMTELAPALGIDELRVPTTNLRGMKEGATGWWKFSSIVHHAEADQLDSRAVIWTDDDLAYSYRLSREARDWVEARQKLELVTLGISPDDRRGLTMAHLDEIRKVIEAA